jgi:PhzF family phenazine biosynthesis protein
MKIKVKQVDAFTETPLTGNPAGVVIQADGLSERQMQMIAREISVSETAFFLPPSTPAANIRLRWFSPSVEIPLCGHATVAGFHALAEEGLHGMKSPGTYKFLVETKSGILPVTVEKTESTIDVLFGLLIPEFTRAGQFKLDVMRILNITLEEFENRMPIVASGYLYVPIRRLHTIFAMKPNIYALSQFLTNRNLAGLCVFTTETVDRGSHVHSRFFAPTVGINEDPVTGSANGPLGVYLFERGEIEPTGETIDIIGEQGDVIGRKGRVLIRLTVQGPRVTALQIGGRGVTVIQGEMQV